MAQMNLYLNEEQEEKIKKLKFKWDCSKHDSILKIINEYKEE